MDAARQLAQLVERAGELGLGLLEQPGNRFGAALQRALGEAQLQRERDEALLRAVVQVALQPAALGIARAHDARAGGGELVVRVGVGERLRDEVGEVAQALLGSLGQRALVDRGGDERSPEAVRELDRRGHAGAVAVRAEVLDEAPARPSDTSPGAPRPCGTPRRAPSPRRRARSSSRPGTAARPVSLQPPRTVTGAGDVVAHDASPCSRRGLRGLAHDLPERCARDRPR